MNVLIHREGQQFGPYTLEQARGFLADGSLTITDLAWPDGATKWVPLGEVLKPAAPPARKRSLWKTIGLVLAGGFLVLMFVWVIWRVHLASQVNAHLAALKAAGYPTNPKEMDAWYPAVPGSENSALAFLQATNALAKRNSARVMDSYRAVKKLPRTAPLPPELQNALAADLKQCWNAPWMVHKAVKFQHGRFPVDFSQAGFARLLPHLSPVKSAAQVMRVEAWLAAEQAQPGTAASDAVRDCLALGRMIKTEPTTISQLVRLAANYIAADALERVLNRASLPDDQLASLAAAFEEADDPTALARALAGERAGTIPYFRLSKADAVRLSENSDQTAMPLSGGPGAMRFTGFFERDLLFYLQAMETNIALLNLPAPQSLMATNVNDALCLEGRRKLCILSGLLMPAHGRLAMKAADDSARLRVARTALAIERFRLAHQNQLPGSLAALASVGLATIPTDPWDGQPLRFKKLAKGYVVYSIGPDGKDDDGTEQATDENGKRVAGPFDITFTVER